MRKIGLLALVLVFVSLLAIPAEAGRQGRADTRNVQEKLTLLGYDPGPIDGLAGRRTNAAIRKFQEDAKLAVDGVVGRRTRAAMEEALEKGGVGNYRRAQANIMLDIYEDVLTDRLAKGSVKLPSRYADVEVSKVAPGRFAVSINGQKVATSPGANALPRISRTFQLPGADAYVFAAPSANRNCRLEHTVMVVRKDGTFMAPTPVGNCKEILNGRVQDDQLVLSYPPLAVPSWRIEETWIYVDGQIVQK